MAKIKLSVIVPSWKDPILHKTIDDLINKSGLGDALEIIPVLDGYWPTTPIKNDDRIKVVHKGNNTGMREAINAGVRVARGEFIMRLDEHCCFGDRYDLIMTSQCLPNQMMTATRYYLDPNEWKVMDIEPVYHEKFVIQKINDKGDRKFAGVRWRERDEQLKEVPITETMAMQGSMWITPRKWFLEVFGELQTEGYGALIQDSVEATMKTWKAGGQLVLNKNTWFAHKHRSFPRTHNNGTKDTPANCDQGYAYSLSVWEDYYRKEIVPKWGI
jgi:hypothetical protein